MLPLFRLPHVVIPKTTNGARTPRSDDSNEGCFRSRENRCRRCCRRRVVVALCVVSCCVLCCVLCVVCRVLCCVLCVVASRPLYKQSQLTQQQKLQVSVSDD